MNMARREREFLDLLRVSVLEIIKNLNLKILYNVQSEEVPGVVAS